MRDPEDDRRYRHRKAARRVRPSAGRVEPVTSEDRRRWCTADPRVSHRPPHAGRRPGNRPVISEPEHTRFTQGSAVGVRTGSAQAFGGQHVQRDDPTGHRPGGSRIPGEVCVGCRPARMSH